MKSNDDGELAEQSDMSRRIERLESRVRRSRRLNAAALLGCVAFVSLSVQDPSPVADEVRAKRFVVVGEGEQPLATLGIDPIGQGGQLFLSSKDRLALANVVTTITETDGERSGAVVVALTAEQESARGVGGSARWIVTGQGSTAFLAYESEGYEQYTNIVTRAEEAGASTVLSDTRPGDGKATLAAKLSAGHPALQATGADGTVAFELP